MLPAGKCEYWAYGCLLLQFLYDLENVSNFFLKSRSLCLGGKKTLESHREEILNILQIYGLRLAKRVYM